MKPIALAVRVSACCLMLSMGVMSAFCQTNSAPSPQIQKIQNGVQLALGDLNVKAQFYAEGTVRIVKWPTAGKADKLSLTVIQKELPSLDVQVAESAAGVTLSDGLVKVIISKSDGAIQYFDKDGKTILQEQGKAIFTPATNPREEKAFNLQQNFTLNADEGVYGLGQFQDGIMNYRGHSVKLVQAMEFYGITTRRRSLTTAARRPRFGQRWAITSIITSSMVPASIRRLPDTGS
jgi:alpha-D-xyloside xylohydrolase